MKCCLKISDLAASVHYFLTPSEAFSVSSREEQHVLHVHNGQDKNRAKIKPHTDGMKRRNTWSEAYWSVRICYLHGAVVCRCSCLGWRDAVSSVPARPVPASSLSQDLRIWVQPLWDAGKAVKGYVQLRVGVPKIGEMELMQSQKIPIQTFHLAAAKP